MALPKSRYKQLEDRWALGSDNKTDWYASIRKNSQATLIYIADSLKFANKRFYTHHGPYPGNRTNASTAPSTYDLEKAGTPAASWRTGYTMFAPITSQKQSIKKTSTVEDPLVAFNKLTGATGGLIRFFNFQMTPAQQAALVPKIRVFKIEYKTEKIKGSSPAKYQLKMPFELEHEREIVFSTYTKSSDLEKITAHTKAREDATGIQSFTWDLKGVNPAEVDANIEAEMKIFFNNVDDIFRNNIIRRKDSPDRALASFLDLVLFSPPVGTSNSSPFPSCAREEGEGKHFEIRVDVGWQNPPKEMVASQQDSYAFDSNRGGTVSISGRSVPHPKELFSHTEASYVGEMRTSLYMQLTDHKFDFKDDGSATLTANYRARSTMVDRRYNLLEHTKNQTQHQRDEVDDARNPAGEGSTDDGAPEPDEEHVADKEETLTKAMNAEYKQIIKELVLKHVYTIDLPLELLLNFRGSDFDLGEKDLNTKGVGNNNLRKGKVLSYNGLWQTLFRPQVQAGGQLNAAGQYVGSASGTYIYNRVLYDLNKTYGSISQFSQMNIKGPSALDKDRGDLEVGQGRDQTVLDFTSPIMVPGRAHYGSETADTVTTAQARRALTEDYAEYAVSGDLLLSELNSDIEGRDYDDDGAPRKMKTNFFFFGDILEVFMRQESIVNAMRGDGDGGDKMNLGVVLLDLMYLNPRKVLGKMARRGGSGGQLSVDGINYYTWKCSWNQMKKTDQAKYLSILNVANIPIVVELFLDFLKAKIVSQQRTEYYLEDFITDVFNRFVKPVIMNHGMLNQPPTGMQSLITSMTVDPTKTPFFKKNVLGYVNGPTVPAKPHFLYDVLAPKDPAAERHWSGANYALAFPQNNDGAFNENYTIGTYAWNGELKPKSSTLTTLVAGGGSGPSEVKVSLAPFREPEHQLKDMRNARRSTLDQNRPKTPATDVKFVGFYGMHTNQSGRYDVNITKGINNFVGALSAGCVKSISFTRVDQPHVREARTSKAKTFGRSQLRELYNVKVILYGNTLLKPGQMMYVEANPMMFGFPWEKNSVANLLGMGGYYLVTEVNNELSSEGWTTTATGLHCAWPTGGPSHNRPLLATSP